MSGFMDALDALGRGAMDLLFPRRCPFCGAVTGRALLCEGCEKALPRCETVRTGADFGRAAAPLLYRGRAREAILRYKFKGQMGGLPLFGQMMAACAVRWYDGAFDAVTWVPVSGKRLRQRGFDQARYLAGSVCVDWHQSPQETLRKIVDNPPQSGIADPAQRRANVLGAYEAVRPEDIAGRRFLLIDDVFTTGATLGECARVLRAAGAADVVCLTLAITPQEAE